MAMTKIRVVSVEEATAKLDALARLHNLTNHCYDESASKSIEGFDAMKWVTLCAQRNALRQRESEASLPFFRIYQTAHCTAPVSLTNQPGGLNKLAA